MRIFTNRWFQRWAKSENITDDILLNVASEVAAGQVEAVLGGYLFKKRIARPGKGKSGGYRTIIGYTQTPFERIIFLYAFAKSARDNITNKEKTALSIVAKSFLLATDTEIEIMLTNCAFFEVCSNE